MSQNSLVVAAIRCSALLICCCVWVTLSSEIEVDPAWENVFRTRNHEDWKAVWHTERHRRCYHDLLVHMDWVCQKDIYAIRDKRELTLPHSATAQKWQSEYRTQPDSGSDQDDDEEDEVPPFLELKEARSFLGRGLPLKQRRERRSHERKKRGIIDECCHASMGCSWEEYAEYCPANSRIRSQLEL